MQIHFEQVHDAILYFARKMPDNLEHSICTTIHEE